MRASLAEPVATMCVISLLCGLLATCTQQASFDYRSADPVAAARCALIDSGHFHLLAIKLRDSLIVPVDSEFAHRSFSVEVGPEGGLLFLPVDEAPGMPGRPSPEQLAFMKRFNTESVALLDSNAMVALPADVRTKLVARGNCET